MVSNKDGQHNFYDFILQKSALMTAQRDLYLGNSPSSFDTDN